MFNPDTYRRLAAQQEDKRNKEAAAEDPSTYAERFGAMIETPEELQRIQEARPEEIAQLVQMRREQLGGLGSEGYSAARQQMMAQQGAAEQQAQRQLARQQAISGIRGGAATKQSSRLAQQLAQQRAMQEQQLFLTDVGEKQRALGAYEQTLGGAVSGEQERQLFNISQQQREQLAQQARQLTIAQLSQQQALGAQQAAAARYYADRMQQTGGGGGGGGCCIIAAITTAGLSGIDSAMAQEIIAKSKGTKAERIELIQANMNRADVLEAIERLNDIRDVRDASDIKTKRGYYRFSEATLPVIKRIPGAMMVGNMVMVKPIQAVKTKPNSVSAFIGKVWIKAWSFIGGNKPFIRNNGEVV